MLRPSTAARSGLALLCVLAASAGAQVPSMPTSMPSPAEAQALLQARPELAAQVRQRIVTSGMTPEQIRARLKAEGYPESMLDGYLPSATGAMPSPNEDVLTAVARLGIADESEVALMRTMLGRGGALPAAAPVRDDLAARITEEAQELFGLSLFRSQTSEFVPSLDGPVDANYRLGPGDQLVLILTGEVELAHTLDVTREGFIVIPQVGQIGVANLTLAQLEDLLFARLARSYSGVRRGADAPTKFSLSVSRLRAIQVFVTGDVVRPSSYRISSASTAMTALYAAGGPTENGTMRDVSVRRAGRVVATLDVYDYLLRGDNAKDARLENGDVVFVRPHGPRVRVSGEVLRAATYELREGETIRDALTVAGGFRPTAQTQRIQLQRIVPPADRTAGGRDRTVIDVTGGRAIADLPSLSVSAGDEIRVFAVSDRVRNAITLEGHVWTPGRQALTPGLTLSQALRNAGGLKPDGYLGQVLVSRLRADSTRLQLRATLRDTTGTVINDLALEEDDQIRVFSLTEFRPERYVAIGGSVRRGGRYPWREGMTLRDLVLLAGGLREGAYLREAELARLPREREGGATATTVRVALDSSYLGDYVQGRPYRAAPGQVSPAFGSAPEVTLDPYDNVLILEQPDWQLQRTVVLTGEVKFPGRYALRSKNERISDIIAHAGGLTATADADAAFFARRRSSTSFVGEAASIDVRTRVGVALDRALARPQSDENLVLMDEDSLHIPFRRTTVEIRGAVNAPTAVTVEGGRGIGYYVRAAGGAAATGDEGKVYVIQPNGKIEAVRRILWVFRIAPEPRAGATVVVPVKQQATSSGERAATIALIAQTLASLAAVAALLR
jgi:polysaccharide export outer membrane protein